MAHSKKIFRGKRTLSIMPTYTCTAACANCASLSSPTVRSERTFHVASFSTQSLRRRSWASTT